MASSIGELQQRGHHAGVVFGDLMVFVQVRKEGGREGGREGKEGRQGGNKSWIHSFVS